jgi:protein O-GlcNAc transferase
MVTIAEALASGTNHQRAGQWTEAERAFRQVLELDPGNRQAYSLLGLVLHAQGKLVEVETCFRDAVRANPTNGRAHYNLGVILHQLGNLDEAGACFENAVRLNPNHAAAYSNLGVWWQSQGRLDEAIDCYRRAIRLEPDNAETLSNYLYALNFHPTCDAATIFREHRAWAEQHADPLSSAAAPHVNDRSPRRRLRVGYVSAHFRQHAVNYFIEPILASHDHGSCEIFCYADALPADRDETTKRLEGYADHWRNITGQSDERVSELVRSDRIDLLVDLAGHIGGNRLLVFARKPAPVQVAYLGYQATTGMLAMDYRLTDAWADPPGATDEFYSEKLERLPKSFFCFRQSAGAPEVSSLPVLQNQFITFGSFNNFSKVGPQVLATWADVLRAVPNSRMILLCPNIAALGERVLNYFASQGVSRDHVELAAGRPKHEFLRLIARVDIALDAFPFNGHTTTCDALWMGVPVVMLAGTTYASRFGSSGLMSLGLTDLVTASPEEYASVAIRLAGDLSRLKALRAGLRGQMASSALLDAQQFTHDLEAAYREMWVHWCGQVA